MPPPPHRRPVSAAATSASPTMPPPLRRHTQRGAAPPIGRVPKYGSAAPATSGRKDTRWFRSPSKAPRVENRQSPCRMQLHSVPPERRDRSRSPHSFAGAPEATVAGKSWSEYLRKEIVQAVTDAVAPIQHEETQWSPSELVKRLVAYIEKGAHDLEYQDLAWHEMTRNIVRKAMDSYSAVCFNRPWFNNLNLERPLCIAIWKVLTQHGRQPDAYSEVKSCVVAELDENRGTLLLMDGMKTASLDAFGDEATANKVQECLLRAYNKLTDNALNRAVNDDDDVRLVESFVTSWLHDTMGRAWLAVRNPEKMLSRGNVLRLFQGLVSPFGDEHDFSCIPKQFWFRGSPPPREWPFLEGAVEELFHAWDEREAKRRGKLDTEKEGASGGEPHRSPAQVARRLAALKKLLPVDSSPDPLRCDAGHRRAVRQDANTESEGGSRRGTSDADSTIAPQRPQAGRSTTLSGSSCSSLSPIRRKSRVRSSIRTSDRESPFRRRKRAEQAQVFPSAQSKARPAPAYPPVARVTSPGPPIVGHPRCTSAEECVGSVADRLIQHWLPGEERGDVYCLTCWRILQKAIPGLKQSGRPLVL